jgi:lipoprotein signal peptidase
VITYEKLKEDVKMENTLKNKLPSTLAILASVIVTIPLVAILDSMTIIGYRTGPQPLALPILAIILTIFCLVVFRSNRTALSKAVYAVVPVTIILYYILNAGAGWPTLTNYLIGALFAGCVLAYLLFKKKDWRYRFSVIATSAVTFIAAFSWVLYCNAL